MSNMGYCRFRNTLADLQDCYWDLQKRGSPDGRDENAELLSKDERQAAEELIQLCNQIVEFSEKNPDEYNDDYLFYHEES